MNQCEQLDQGDTKLRNEIATMLKFLRSKDAYLPRREYNFAYTFDSTGVTLESTFKFSELSNIFKEDDFISVCADDDHAVVDRFSFVSGNMVKESDESYYTKVLREYTNIALMDTDAALLRDLSDNGVYLTRYQLEKLREVLCKHEKDSNHRL
jgi:hypothetical protein